MPKCPKCGNANPETALFCEVCQEVFKKEQAPDVTIQRGTASFGRHGALPLELISNLSKLAAARPGLKAVYLFTMSIDGAPPLSAFGFAAEGDGGMRDAQLFLRDADPLMPAALISSDMQCLPMSPADRAKFGPIAIRLLDR